MTSVSWRVCVCLLGLAALSLVAQAENLDQDDVDGLTATESEVDDIEVEEDLDTSARQMSVGLPTAAPTGRKVLAARMRKGARKNKKARQQKITSAAQPSAFPNLPPTSIVNSVATGAQSIASGSQPINFPFKGLSLDTSVFLGKDFLNKHDNGIVATKHNPEFKNVFVETIDNQADLALEGLDKILDSLRILFNFKAFAQNLFLCE